MTPPPGFLMEIVVRTGDGEPLATNGRTTGVPGLVANLAPAGTGLWGITHERSGISLGWWTPDPELAMRFAWEVAPFCDWTISGAEIRRRATEINPKVREAGSRLGLESAGITAPSRHLGDIGASP